MGPNAGLIAFGQSWAVVRDSSLALANADPADPKRQQAKAAIQRADAAYQDRTQLIHRYWLKNAGTPEDVNVRDGASVK